MKTIWIFLMTILMIGFSSVSLAANKPGEGLIADTALFVQLDPTGVAKPKEMETLIYQDVSEKIRSVYHDTISAEKAQRELRTYIREHGDTLTRRDADKGFIFKRRDFKALADMEKVRYIMLVSPRITAVENKDNIWTGDRKNLTVITEVVIYDAEEDEYIVDEELTSLGKTSGSKDRAYHRAIKDMLKQLKFNY